jgi:predicted nucleic acid-binding protein
MILADTSVWINHFHTEILEVQKLLDREKIVIHQTVLGELSVGNIHRRRERFLELSELGYAATSDFEECLMFVETHRLYGIGLSWNDVQLLCSAKQNGYHLWTFDKTLDRAARHLGIAYASVH